MPINCEWSVMSSIIINDLDLLFKVQQEKKIKDILTAGNRRFSEYGADSTVHALKKINLKCYDGERIAVIGHNGAGKSTLLRVISGIYRPTGGSIKVQGRVSGLYEFATGFEMENNGWDNIYLRGLMLGETPEQIKAKMRSIAEFSELGNFLNMPVKYYSSGMLIRLAFSVSTSIEPDILLLDEALSAGDAEFIQKANRRMKEMRENSRVLVLVTHSMESAREMCNRCIWLERGELVMDGIPSEVAAAYMGSIGKN